MINPSRRTLRFHYAIRNIVSAAELLERSGRQVTYLNIGDPQAFGFCPPGQVVEAVQRALRDRFTGYAHSTGLAEARESIATQATGLGSPTASDEVIITSGASEAADLGLTALLNSGDEVLLPAPGYPIYPAILGKLGANARYYKLEASNNWQPSVDEMASLINERSKAIVLINPNNPTGSITRDETTARILALAAEHELLVIADEVYRELCFGAPPTPASILAEAIGTPLITLESLSKTHLIPGWRVGWMRFTKADKMPDLITAITRLASGRLCSPTPTQYAIKPALEGDRSFMAEFAHAIKSRRDFAISQVNAINGLSCNTPEAAFYLMVRVADLDGRTDEQFVLEMLEWTGVLVVHGSGFGCNPRDGYFRLVYLADEQTLRKALTEVGRFVTHTPRAVGNSQQPEPKVALPE
jgi:alanine-synthesizing transaminase